MRLWALGQAPESRFGGLGHSRGTRPAGCPGSEIGLPQPFLSVRFVLPSRSSVPFFPPHLGSTLALSDLPGGLRKPQRPYRAPFSLLTAFSHIAFLISRGPRPLQRGAPPTFHLFGLGAPSADIPSPSDRPFSLLPHLSFGAHFHYRSFSYQPPFPLGQASPLRLLTAPPHGQTPLLVRFSHLLGQALVKTQTGQRPHPHPPHSSRGP